MKKRDNEHAGQLHCRNCDGYYDPSLPTCPHCGEETDNNVESARATLSVAQYGGGFGEAGSTLGRAALLIVVVLLLVALASAVVLCIQSLSEMEWSTPAPTSSATDPADGSAPGDESAEASGTGSAAPVVQEPVQEEPIEVKAKSITLDYDDLTLESGESYTLKATVAPAEWEGQLTWSSDDEKIATVSQDGQVTYVGGGQCTVTVTAGDVRATCIVRCQGAAVSEQPEQEETGATGGQIDLNFGYADMTLTNIGDTYTFSPSGGTGSYSWSSADSSVVSVSSSGTVTAVSYGRTTVTCTSGDASAEILIYVGQDGKAP